MNVFRMKSITCLSVFLAALLFSGCGGDGSNSPGGHDHHDHYYYGGYGGMWYYDDDDYPGYVVLPPGQGDGSGDGQRPERPIGDRPRPEHPIADVPDRERPSTRPAQRPDRSMSGSRSRPSIPSRSRGSRGGGRRR